MTDDTKLCPYCAEAIKAAAIVCRHCGRDLTPSAAEAPDPDPGRAFFELAVERHLEHGWQVRWKDDTRAQLVKPKRFSGGCLGLILAVALGGLFWPPLLLLSLGGLLVGGLLYLMENDEVRYLDASTILQNAERAASDERPERLKTLSEEELANRQRRAGAVTLISLVMVAVGLGAFVLSDAYLVYAVAALLGGFVVATISAGAWDEARRERSARTESVAR